ncbi:unnamed protein product, partial [Ectocarpus fasciculatus]
KTPITGDLWEQRRKLLKLGLQFDGMVGSRQQTEVVEKTVEGSRMSVSYDFVGNPSLKHLYVDTSGNILLGKLFEDLDALAGNIAAVHCDDDDETTAPLSLVTASVDKIIQRGTISLDRDYCLFGQMAYVGRSSMDILIHMHKGSSVRKHNGAVPPLSESLLKCYFTYAARDPFSGKSVTVNRLLPTTPAEQDIFEERESVVAMRKNSSPVQPTSRHMLTNLVERGSAMVDMPALAHPNAVLMARTALENCFLCHPQNVNTAGAVFGGFLMHRAYDLAEATCYTFAGSPVKFIEVEKIEFRKPVQIGDMIRLKSRVVFSSDDPLDPIAEVEVTCQIVKPERASSYVSNKFKFVFGFKDSGVTLRRILPQNYEEAETLICASRWTAS